MTLSSSTKFIAFQFFFCIYHKAKSCAALRFTALLYTISKNNFKFKELIG